MTVSIAILLHLFQKTVLDIARPGWCNNYVFVYLYVMSFIFQCIIFLHRMAYPIIYSSLLRHRLGFWTVEIREASEVEEELQRGRKRTRDLEEGSGNG